MNLFIDRKVLLTIALNKTNQIKFINSKKKIIRKA